MIRVAGRFTRVEFAGFRAADHVFFIDRDVVAAGKELNGCVGKIVHGPARYFFKAEEFCGKAAVVAVKDRFCPLVHKNGIREFAVFQDLCDDPGCPSETDPFMRPELVGVHEIKLIVGHDSILMSGHRFAQSFRAYGIFGK